MARHTAAHAAPTTGATAAHFPSLNFLIDCDLFVGLCDRPGNALGILQPAKVLALLLSRFQAPAKLVGAAALTIKVNIKAAKSPPAKTIFLIKLSSEKWLRITASREPARASSALSAFKPAVRRITIEIDRSGTPRGANETGRIGESLAERSAQNRKAL